jgi:RNA polymerase sigma factor (sigma-70 family)
MHDGPASADAAPSADRTPPTLIRRVQENQPDAWDSFVRIYRPLLCRWAQRRLRVPPADVENAVQNVLLRLLGKVREYQPERGRFRAWLLTLTRNTVTDFWRRKQHQIGEGVGGSGHRQQMEEVAATGEEPGEAERRAECRELVRRALDELRRATRLQPQTLRAFRLFVLEGQPASAVAAELGVETDAVYVAVGRVKARLQKLFAEVFDW